MPSRFRKTPERVFRVHLTVHQLDSIPALHRLLYIQWRARRATPTDGRTPSQPVQKGNLVRWDHAIIFDVAIPSDPSDPTVLMPSPLTLHLRSERRTRWVGTPYQAEGLVELDLSEVAAVGSLSKNYLVQKSLLNTTLKVSIRVLHQSGDKIFRTRTLPNVSSSSTPDVDDDRDVSHDLPPLHPDPSERNSTSMLHTSNSSFAQPDPDASSPFDAPDTPSTVLQNSIPNPDIGQKEVYERMFQHRLRDAWPSHIVASRQQAATVVNNLYAAVCAEDGIGATPMQVRQESLPLTDTTLCLDRLIESRDAAHVTPLPQQPLMLRKGSARSPRLSVRSSSMGEIPELTGLGA